MKIWVWSVLAIIVIAAGFYLLVWPFEAGQVGADISYSKPYTLEEIRKLPGADAAWQRFKGEYKNGDDIVVATWKNDPAAQEFTLRREGRIVDQVEVHKASAKVPAPKPAPAKR